MRYLSNLFVLTLLLALVLRIYLLIWSVTYPLDLNGDQFRYEDWAQTAHISNFSSTYERTYGDADHMPNTMPPGTLYVATGAYESYIVIGKIVNKITHTAAGSIHWVNTYLFHIMMRVPSVISDILMGVLLFLLIRKEVGYKRGVLAASLIWFNPLVIYNSTIWGQMDSITNFFFILALYLAYKKKYIFSILSFTASVYIKFSLLPLLPFYFVFLYFLSGKQWKKLLAGVVISIGGIVLATYPISSSPVTWLITHWPMFSKGEWQFITSAAFNFWWMVTCLPTYCPPVQVSNIFLGVSLGTWAYILFACLTLPILYFQITKSKLFITKKYAFFAFALIALAVFLVMPRMHDRYLYPFFPLFAVVVAMSKDMRKYLILFCVLSFVHFANLLSSWYATRYPALILHDISYSLPYRWSISVLTVITSVILYILSIKEFRLKKSNQTTKILKT